MSKIDSMYIFNLLFECQEGVVCNDQVMDAEEVLELMSKGIEIHSIKAL